MKGKMYLNEKEKYEARIIIQEKTGYMIRTNILNQIFRRSSVAVETGEKSNEILEFVGDQVLSYFVVKIVSKRCGSISPINGYSFRINENKFTQVKQALTNNEALAKIIDEWNIAEYLLFGKSDIKNEVTEQTKIKADLFEAVIGAIAIDSNWDAAILESVISKAIGVEERLEVMIASDVKVRNFDIDNAITTLKEIAESGQCTMPKYEFAGPERLGYDEDGNPKWWCRCEIVNDKTGIGRSVYATSKKNAKKAVAYVILCEHLDMQNKYGPNDWYLEWLFKEGKLIPKR